MPPAKIDPKTHGEVPGADSFPRATASRGVAIKTFNLTKRFGDFTALSACSLHIPAGRTFGLLGPNGAGKSTLLRLLLGFLHPTSGQCRIGTVATAESPIAARSQVSYLPGDARLPRQMRGKQTLRYFADLHPDGNFARSIQVAETLQLDLNRYVGFMSTGMRQKLALAIVLGPQTPVLILDEPTANLDPTVRHLVLEYVEQARDDGRTVIFSSHVMSEIEQTCDRVGFLRQGKLVGELVMHDLAQRHRIAGTICGDELARVTQRIEAGERWLEFPETSGRILDPSDADLQEEAGPVTAASGPHPVRRRLVIQTGADLAEVLPWLLEHRVTDLRIEPVGLNTVYESVHRGDENANLFFEPVDLETEP